MRTILAILLLSAPLGCGGSKQPAVEVPTMGFIDVAVAALLVVEPLPCARAHGDTDVGRDDRGAASRLIGSLVHPAARLGGMGGQHPVEQDAVGDRATEIAHPRSHGCDDDARPLRKELTSSATARCTRWIGARSWPDPTPIQSFAGSEPEPGDLCHDPAG